MEHSAHKVSSVPIFRLRLTLLLLSVILICGPATVFGQARLTGQTMGTYYSIVIDGVEQDAAQQVHQEVKDCLADVNRQMSTWDPESEISRFNQQQSTDWFDVSPQFAEVVQEASRIHKLTGGAFDPTLAPLISLWGFGDQRPKQMPTPDEIAAAKQHVGMELIEIRMAPPGLRKTDAAVQLNLSAIAKGHGVDRVSQLLTDAGHAAHIVDIGGETRAAAAKASGQAWRIGVESPVDGLNRVVEVTHRSIATSGDYRNFFELDGVRYSHAISPLTGRPVVDPPASISVMHSSCMTADAFATALMVMGVEQGMKLARQETLSVLFQTVDENNTLAESATGEFEQARQGQPDKQDVSSVWWLPFVAALGIFLLAMLGMAIGVLVRNRQLKGSCGGLSSMAGSDGRSICELCTVPEDECVNSEIREKLAKQAADEGVSSK